MPAAALPTTAEPVEVPSVAVLGVRHHGPGSARSVQAALAELSPDLVLIEGPPELDALVPLAGHPDLVPPVAGLVHAVDEPRRALFYPMAEFSPEWVALRWAVARGVEVRFADLPATNALALTEEVDVSEGDGSSGPHTEAPVPHRPDAIAELARVAGYDDPERWWEDAVEHRRDSAVSRFAALTEAMRAVRAEVDASPGADAENSRREAAMRRAIREAQKQGSARIAFVCGAYHAPALDPAAHPPASHDNALLKGLRKVKVSATWVPWTAKRLATASGYGAGVTSPGWYQHLFLTEDDEVVPGWLVRVARALRDQQLDAAPASLVEAARLAEALAAVRGRPSVGLAELTDASRAVLSEGSDVPLSLIDRSLVVGEALGTVPAEAPTVPLATDLARQVRSVRLKQSATSTTVQLDLRRENGLARSVLLHRLALLGIDWGEPVDVGRSGGTFKEAWELEWRPELSVAVIEASLHGNTVESAATDMVREKARSADDLAALGDLVGRCLLADLPGGLAEVVDVLAERTARQHDVLGLLQTIEPLARTCRYGDVRGVDTSRVRSVLGTVVVRASLGLGAACQSLDDTAAAQVRATVEAADRGIGLLDDAELATPWHRALTALATRQAVHGSVSGRVNRLLLDADLLDREEAARRLSRQLSVGADATAGAAWLDGFLTGEALMLLHDDALLAVVDDWVAGVAEETFDDLLPLLRRTFSAYEPAERRQIGRHLLDRGTGRARPAAVDLDLERARPAMARMARLLGLEVAHD